MPSFPEILPSVLRVALVMGLFVFSIGIWRRRLQASEFAALVASWMGAFILISVPFETASRLVVAGIEIDARVERAEEVVDRFLEIESRLNDSETQIVRLQKIIEIYDIRMEMAELQSRIGEYEKDLFEHAPPPEGSEISPITQARMNILEAMNKKMFELHKKLEVSEKELKDLTATPRESE